MSDQDFRYIASATSKQPIFSSHFFCNIIIFIFKKKDRNERKDFQPLILNPNSHPGYTPVKMNVKTAVNLNKKKYNINYDFNKNNYFCFANKE